MKDQKEIIKYSGIVFIFFLIVGFLIPYTGDDWNNLLHNGSLTGIIKTAISAYNTFEGRFFSRILDLFLIYYKPLWVIINALGMTFLYYFIARIVKIKKAILYVFIASSLLLIDEESFSQIYVWLTGNITYFIPMLFILLLIYLNKNIFEKNSTIKYPKYLYILLPILSFISSMFVENVSVGIITTLILIAIYDYIKNKKVNILMIVCMIISSVGLYLMLSSPGTLNRIDSLSSFSNLNVFQKIMVTFPRQMSLIFIKNSFFVLCLVFISCYLVWKNYEGIKRKLYIIFLSVIPIITALEHLYDIVRRHGIRYIDVFLTCKNWYVLLYWSLFAIFIVYLVIKYVKKDQSKMLFFFLIALINNASMLISPLAGGRTQFLSSIMLFICLFIVLNNLDIKILDNKKLIIINKIGFYMLIVMFLSFYMYCNVLDFKREKYIYTQLRDSEKAVESIMLPGIYLWNANPWDDWHMHTFKIYYRIPKAKQVIIKKMGDCSL